MLPAVHFSPQVPLLLWACAIVVSFGVSFLMLKGLQMPLSSLNAAAHVNYRFARCRLVANNYAFATNPAELFASRQQLADELATLKREYSALLYGGSIPPVVRLVVARDWNQMDSR